MKTQANANRTSFKVLVSAVLLASLSLLTLTAQAFSLPDDDPLSGQFITVSRGLDTLGDTGSTEAFNVTILVPNTDGDAATLSETLIIDIFDGNIEGVWEGNNPHDEQTFRLFRDPTATGNTAAVDEIALINNTTASMPDNAFVNIFSGTVDPGTYNAARDAYVYHLVADWDTLLVADESNNFKVRVNDPATPLILAGSSVGLIGLDTFTGAGANFPDTSYTGDLSIRLIIPNPEGSVCDLLVFNGDLDHGDDTDDANSPARPPFMTSPSTLNQGANTGAPLDDNPNPEAVRTPDVFIEVTGPNGSYLVTDPDPSGNSEWELFHIASSSAACPPADPTADVVVASLDPGLHTITLRGLDIFNNTFFNTNVDIVPTPEMEECSDCDGRVSTLTLQNNGAATDVQVFQGGVTDPIFDGTVSAGGLFVVNPAAGEVNLGTEISVVTADGVCAVGNGGKSSKTKKGSKKTKKGSKKTKKGSKKTKKGSKKGNSSNCTFHTSCSRPIGPGSVAGPFEVVTGESLDGGLLCPLDMQGGDFACAKPLDALTMIWDGNQEVGVQAWKDEPGELLLHSQNNVLPGDEVEVTGYAPKDGNNVIWEVYEINTNGSKLGESVFHMSCSDDDMDGAEDCGKPEGNGKSNNASFINTWVLEGMVDAQGVLNCTP